MITEPSTVIELVASTPEGPIACDITIATQDARQGLEDLRTSMLSSKEITDGIEIHFEHSKWDSVQRYVELESRCCSFLNLRAEKQIESVVLTITGRLDATGWIRSIFA